MKTRIYPKFWTAFKGNFKKGPSKNIAHSDSKAVMEEVRTECKHILSGVDELARETGSCSIFSMLAAFVVLGPNSV